MLEPDVTFTDLVLAVQCAVFAAVLRTGSSESRSDIRHFFYLFLMLAISSLFGGIWHGVYSESAAAVGDGVWFGVMAALALAAALVWLISGDVSSSALWSRIVPWVAVIQLVLQLSVSAFLTDRFIVAAVGLLFPIAAVLAGHAAQIRKEPRLKAIYGASGFALAALAALVIVFDVSLHPEWATTLAVYHMVQFVAFWLVFLSVPTSGQDR